MNPHQSARAASMGRTGRLSGRRVHQLADRYSSFQHQRPELSLPRLESHPLSQTYVLSVISLFRRLCQALGRSPDTFSS